MIKSQGQITICSTALSGLTCLSVMLSCYLAAIGRWELLFRHLIQPTFALIGETDSQRRECFQSTPLHRWNQSFCESVEHTHLPRWYWD